MLSHSATQVMQSVSAVTQVNLKSDIYAEYLFLCIFLFVCLSSSQSLWSFEGECDEHSWPDVDHGKVCGDCKVIFLPNPDSIFRLTAMDIPNISFCFQSVLCQVLVTHMDTVYSSCSNYCSSLGRGCVGAWEEDHDTCGILSTEDCNHDFGSYTSDAICQCGGTI